MTITKVEDGFKASHLITGLDDEGNTVNIERRELSCISLEEAKERASEYLVSNGINEEIIIE